MTLTVKDFKALAIDPELTLLIVELSDSISFQMMSREEAIKIAIGKGEDVTGKQKINNTKH